MPRRTKTIEEKMMTPLTNTEICSMLGYKEEDIIPYSKLAEYKTIQELLPEDKCFKILLLEEAPNRGHFVCLYRQEDLIVYFNSYGEKPDRDMKCIPRCIRKMLGEDKPEITRLCDGMKIWYNHKKLQGKDTQTCGRYCVFAIEMMKMGYSPDQVLEALTRYANQNGHESYDTAVCAITP